MSCDALALGSAELHPARGALRRAQRLGGRCSFRVILPIDNVLPLAVPPDRIDSYSVLSGRTVIRQGGSRSWGAFGLTVPLLAGAVVPSALPSAGYGRRRVVPCAKCPG